MVPTESSAFYNEETFIQEKEATTARWNSPPQMDVHIPKRSPLSMIMFMFYDFGTSVDARHNFCINSKHFYDYGIQEAFGVRKQICDIQPRLLNFSLSILLV